jgi:hypothetical protein
MIRLPVALFLVTLMPARVAFADDRVANPGANEPFRPIDNEDHPPIAELPQIDGDIQVDEKQTPTRRTGGTCKVKPTHFGDYRLIFNGNSFSDNPIPRELFDIIKDNDSCPEKMEIHRYHVTCKKEGAEFNVRVDSETGPIRERGIFKLQMTKGKIQRLQYEGHTWGGKKKISTEHATCGEALTS